MEPPVDDVTFYFF